MRYREKDSRAEILRAARHLFSRNGYDKTTTRSIAEHAGYDQALIWRHFGNKRGLFLEATSFRVKFDEVSTEGDWADYLIDVYFQTWESDVTALSMLRSSASNEEARRRFAENFRDLVLPVLSAYAVDRAEERASMWSATIMGVALNRLLLRYEPIASMSSGELRVHLRQIAITVFQGPLPNDNRAEHAPDAPLTLEA